MKKIAWLMLPLSLWLAWWLALVPRGIAQEPNRVEAIRKVAPWIIDHTAAGQTAEFLVILADQADVRGADRLPTKLAKGRYVVDVLRSEAERSQAALIQWLQARGVEYQAFYVVNAIWVKADRDIALALAARADVARLDGNPSIYNGVPQPEKLSNRQGSRPGTIETGIAYVRAPQVWNLGFTGQGIVVGGQDTGYRWDHPALKAQYRGWNGSAATHDYNWHDGIHTNSHGSNSCGINSPIPCDDYGHGTHTMGTVLGDDGGGNQIGMAPGAHWIGCRNMDNGWGSPASYLECFEFFLAPYSVNGTPGQGDPSKAPDVTNNSWSCPNYEGCNAQTLLQAVQAQRAAGILTVVSATNDGPACSTISEPPALYAEAYTVGALNTGTDLLASFSSLGPVTSDDSNRRKPDITAPGTNIRSSMSDGSYGYMSGTSMAAPHVAGAVALLWSARPGLKNDIATTEQLLDDAAVHLDSSMCNSSGWPNNSFGYGRLDIEAALYGVSLGTVPNQSADPASLVTYTLHLTNTGITTDTFSLSLDPGQWSSTLAFTRTKPLKANESLSVTVSTLIPIDALAYAHDSFTVTAASEIKPLRSAATVITTDVHAVRGTFLSPSVVEQYALPNSWITYTLRLTNTGNNTQTYALGLISTRTALLRPSSLTLPARQGQDVQVSLFLPPFLLENAHTYVLTWYDTFTGTLAAFAQLNTLVELHESYLPEISR